MQVLTSGAYISGNFIKSQSISAQRDGNHVKLSGNIILAKAIPNAVNTAIGSIATDNKPLVTTHFVMMTPQGACCLAYISTDATVVVCNYLGGDIVANTELYIIGLEWFFA